MKRCPSCNDFALYDDSIDTCPICGTTLIRYRRRKTMAIREDYLKVIEPVSYTPELTREYDGEHLSLKREKDSTMCIAVLLQR